MIISKMGVNPAPLVPARKLLWALYLSPDIAEEFMRRNRAEAARKQRCEKEAQGSNTI